MLEMAISSKGFRLLYAIFFFFAHRFLKIN